MTLYLQVSDKFDAESFIYDTVLSEMKNYIVLNLVDDRYRMFENYLSDTMKIKQNLKNIMFTIIDNMIVEKSDKSSWRISTNTSLLLKDNRYSLSQIERLIEYGNTEISGIRLISKMFAYIKSNLKTLEAMYIMNVQLLNKASEEEII